MCDLQDLIGSFQSEGEAKTFMIKIVIKVGEAKEHEKTSYHNEDPA